MSSGIPSSSFSSTSTSDHAEARCWCNDHALLDVHLQALIKVGVSGSVDVQQLKDLSRDDWAEAGIAPLIRNAIQRVCRGE